MADAVHNMGLQFKAVSARHARRAALRFPSGETLTYETLDEKSDRAAYHLLARGLRPGDVIALYSEKCPELYAVMIAALKIGVTYVTLDVDSPDERIQSILKICQPKLILADRPFEGAFALQEIQQQITSPHNLAQLIEQVSADSTAYIMFTSGSTGTPKGVAISQRSLLTFSRWCKKQFAISPDDVITGVNAPYFDNSVFDFAASLFNGASLTPVPRETVLQPKQLVEATAGCTVWFSVPSLLIYLTTLRALEAGSWPNMRAILFGGEGYPKAELARLYALYGNQATLWNVYGPTECTCICSAYALTPTDIEDTTQLAPLGHLSEPVTGAVVRDGKRVAPGETGELYLYGPQLAQGYYASETLTTASFTSFEGKRAYQTGDLVRQDPATGYYHFIGRKDRQIKHMGYRIELEEIEAALDGIKGVTQSAVLYTGTPGRRGRLMAFAATSLDETEIKNALGKRLPAYMIPDTIHTCDQLPTNANGKLDRKALQPLEMAHG